MKRANKKTESNAQIVQKFHILSADFCEKGGMKYIFVDIYMHKFIHVYNVYL
jgi:hypothetical protein